MPPQKGQRQPRGLARQQQILDAAFTLYATNGYRATTLAMVAASVGVTEAGVLHHFPSKEALLQAVLAARDNPAPDAEARALDAGGGLASLRHLPTFARVLVDNPLLARFDVVVGGESIANGGPAFDHFAQRRRLIRQLLHAALAAGVDSGELREDFDIAETAAQIVAFMDGIQLQWLLDAGTTDLEAAYQAFVENLERAIRSPRRSPRSSRSSNG